MSENMNKRLMLPKFRDEAEEAQWWFDHQDDLFEQFDSAEAEGRLGRGTLARRASATVSFDLEDLQRATVLAERHGLDFQSYIKSVVHQALLTEEQRGGPAA